MEVFSGRDGSRQAKILIINPNSSKDMTNTMMSVLEPVIRDGNCAVIAYTAPDPAPSSINDNEGIQASDKIVYQEVTRGNLDLSQYDAVLIACYSVHSLVTRLQDFGSHVITGIFEASICTAQLLLRPHSSETWGIITTGKFWEEHLTSGVKSFLGQEPDSINSRFAGVFSTGLTAGDFHVVSKDEVDSKLREAARRLFHSGEVRCVVMGCAGMAGLEQIIRSIAVEVYGPEVGSKVYVVDGVKAGLLQLEETLRRKRIF